LSRLPNAENDGLRNLAKTVVASRNFFWLRPVTPNLTPAGSPLLRTLSGHTDEIYRMEVLPDGRRAISGGKDGTLRVWDLETGAALHTLRHSQGGVQEMLVTPDGSRAICAFQNSWQLRIWNLDDGQELPVPVGASTPVILTTDGQHAVSAFVDVDELKRRGGMSCEENLCKVWDPMTGTAQFNLPSAKFPLVFLPLSMRAISLSRGAALKVWDLSTGQEQAPFDSRALVRQFYVTRMKGS
jgi:WD40 repeat protein